MMFPARASDLPDNSYWNMDGDHGGSNSRDLDVARETTGGWTEFNANGGIENGVYSPYTRGKYYESS